MKKKKKFVWILLVFVVVLIIFATIGKRKGWFGKGISFKIATELSSKRTIVETITANGKIQPETEVKITPDVSGEIIDLQVAEGSSVKKGDLLLKINPDIYLSAIDRMEATLNSAKANLENSRARLTQVKAQFVQTELSHKRSKKLWSDKAISDAEFETAQASYDMGFAEVKAAEETVNSAEFSVKSTEASLKEARENLTKTSIYSPMDGTVSMLNVEQGERVVGTMQMPGTEMLRIANLNIMEVKVDVNENDIVRVSMGDTAIIEVDAYMGNEFKGIVTEIANSANVSGLATDQITSFDVKIRILPVSYSFLIPADKPDFYPFRPGMSATVDIRTVTKTKVLAIPIQAVTTRSVNDTALVKKGEKDDNSEEYDQQDFEAELTTVSDKEETKEKMLEVVFMYQGGKVQLVEVKTGIQDDNYIEVLSGVQENIEIVSAPYSAISKKLKNGITVEKVDMEELFGEH